MFKLKRYLLTTLALALTVAWLAPGVLAATNNKQKPPAKAPVTQSYDTKGAVEKGMLVRLTKPYGHTVEPLTYDESQHLLGVVVDANQSVINLSQKSSKPQVYVATYGTFQVLVSNQNGPIVPGDPIGISNIDGIGMKADGFEMSVLGRALSSFNGASGVIGTAKLTSSDGSSRKVSLGRISVSINVGNNPQRQNGLPGKITKFLKAMGYSINSGNPVSPTRLYLAVAILFIASVVSASLLFAAVRNAMVSIGRNPLAKSQIIKSMLQAVIVSLIIFVIGIFGVYLLLKL